MAKIVWAIVNALMPLSELMKENHGLPSCTSSSEWEAGKSCWAGERLPDAREHIGM